MVSWALKEWQVAVTALLQGKTILLLRKGGIREAKGQFSLAARQVLLLPTLEHQTTTLLKNEFQPLIMPAEQPAADPVRFDGWATITHALPLGTATDLTALLPYLVWNEQFLTERLKWQPDRLLYALLLRAYRLAAPLGLPRHGGYSGCRSWVDLGNAIAVEHSTPALDEAAYLHQVNAILAALPSITPIIP